RGFVPSSTATGDRARLPGAPFVLSRTPWRFRRAAAEVDEDSHAVAGDPHWCGKRATTPRSGPPAPLVADALPLAAVTVLDFTWVVAGPVATRILADHGARVVKVEHPRAPDFGTRRGGLTGNLNRGKQSVVLNMEHASARRLARDLAARADVVVDNFSAR